MLSSSAAVSPFSQRASASAGESVTTLRCASSSALTKATSRGVSTAGAMRTSVIAEGPPERKISPKANSMSTGKRKVQNIAPLSRT